MGMCYSYRNRANYGCESEVYQQERMVFELRKAEWKKERKKLRDEVKRLRTRLEEKEERIREMEEEVRMERKSTEKTLFEGELIENNSTTTTMQMREERARRDETVERWKMLYLAIKNELDDLIQRTHQGTLNWKADEEDLIEELQREVKSKDERIQVLKAQIASMENEEYKRKREVDILRQSLRILSSKNNWTSSTHAVNSHSNSKPSICLTKSLSKLALVN